MLGDMTHRPAELSDGRFGNDEEQAPHRLTPVLSPDRPRSPFVETVDIPTRPRDFAGGIKVNRDNLVELEIGVVGVGLLQAVCPSRSDVLFLWAFGTHLFRAIRVTENGRHFSLAEAQSELAIVVCNTNRPFWRWKKKERNEPPQTFCSLAYHPCLRPSPYRPLSTRRSFSSTANPTPARQLTRTPATSTRYSDNTCTWVLPG